MPLPGIGATGNINIKELFNEKTGKGVTEQQGSTFLSYLRNALNETNNLILDAEKMADDFAAGKTDNIHQVLIAAEKADVALQFTIQIRNKILDAYNEIMRMQI